MDEYSRKRQEICSSLSRETEHNLRLVYPANPPVSLETKSFSKFEDQLWLLPSELSKLIHNVYSVIDEENGLIGRPDDGGVFFRRNDLWAFLKTELPKLEGELKRYQTTLESEPPMMLADNEGKKAERSFLLRRLFWGQTILAIGRELQDSYCTEFSETGLDKNYKPYDENRAAISVAKTLRDDITLVNFSQKYRDILRPYGNFSGKYYTYDAQTKQLKLEGAWPSIERILNNLLQKHGTATYAVLKGYLEVRKDHDTWSACDYDQLAYKAREMAGKGWKHALIGLEVAGVIKKRGSGRRPGERSIEPELIPLVEQVLSRWEKEHPENLSAKVPEAMKPEKPISSASGGNNKARSFDYDAFICHASEDKKEVAEPLATLLMNKGIKVWYDAFKLRVGDSLRRKIDEGLARSRYGIVILSPSFFRKNWPQVELDGLAAREDSEGHKVILPIWHRVDRDDVLKYSPPLAGRLASKTTEGLESVLNELLDVIVEQIGNQLTHTVAGLGQRADTQAKTPPAGQMIPVSPFGLSPELESKLKVVRGYTAAFAIYWGKTRDSLEIVMWYHPMMPAGLGLTDIGGEGIDAADFLDIVHLNPVLKKYEFGLAGKPKSALVVIIEGAETEAWVAPLRLVDSLMGIRSDRIRKAIRALV